MRVRTVDSLSPTPNFVKKSLKGIGPLREDFYHKIPYFDDLGGYLENYTIVKFGTRRWTWSTS